MKKTGERNGVIDVARGIAIVLVVFAHTLYNGRLRNMIYQFHMPLFFLLSGMVLHSPPAHTSREAAAAEFRMILQKRVRAYLLPYCIWGVLFMPVTPSRLLCLLYASRQAVARAGTGDALWFLPVLFLACMWSEALLFAVRDLPRQRLLLLGAAALLFAAGFILPHPLPFGYPFGLDVSLVAAGFMLLGYTAVPLLRCLQAPALAGGGIACMLGFLVVNHQWENWMNMAWESYGDIRLFLLCALLGSMAVLGISAALDKIPGAGRLLRYVGRHTMSVFVLHLAMVSDISLLTGALAGSLNSKIPVIAIQALVNTGLCLALGVPLERWLPFTLGKAGCTDPDSLENHRPGPSSLG